LPDSCPAVIESVPQPIIVTSNRALEERADVFGNHLMASAALDRLTHHAHFISGGVASRIDYYTPQDERRELPVAAEEGYNWQPDLREKGGEVTRIVRGVDRL
jgi:hypothetical protein